MTDKEYNETLKRMVKGAEYLENPLIKRTDYEKGLKLYNELERKILIHKGLIA